MPHVHVDVGRAACKRRNADERGRLLCGFAISLEMKLPYRAPRLPAWMPRAATETSAAVRKCRVDILARWRSARRRDDTGVVLCLVLRYGVGRGKVRVIAAGTGASVTEGFSYSDGVNVTLARPPGAAKTFGLSPRRLLQHLGCKSASLNHHHLCLFENFLESTF